MEPPRDLGHHVFAAYQRLIALRRSSEALARGGIRYAHVSADAIAYLRETPDERLLCLASRAPHAHPATLRAELEPVEGGEARRDGVWPAGVDRLFRSGDLV